MRLSSASPDARWQALLDGRDQFIVEHGQWQEFVDLLNRPRPPNDALRKLLKEPAPWDATPTETPPPAWDAATWLLTRFNYEGPKDPALGSDAYVAQAAHTEGQRAALGVPEEMPTVLLDMLTHVRNGRWDEKTFWKHLRAQLQPTKGAEG